MMRPLCRLRRVALALALAVAALGPEAARARTWRISPDGTGDAPTIQAGIDSAIAGDVVLLAPGTYTWTQQQATLPSMLRLAPGLTLRGEAGAPATILDAESVGRVLECVNAGQVVIERPDISEWTGPLGGSERRRARPERQPRRRHRRTRRDDAHDPALHLPEQCGDRGYGARRSRRVRPRSHRGLRIHQQHRRDRRADEWPRWCVELRQRRDPSLQLPRQSRPRLRERQRRRALHHIGHDRGLHLRGQLRPQRRKHRGRSDPSHGEPIRVAVHVPAQRRGRPLLHFESGGAVRRDRQRCRLPVPRQHRAVRVGPRPRRCGGRRHVQRRAIGVRRQPGIANHTARWRKRRGDLRACSTAPIENSTFVGNSGGTPDGVGCIELLEGGTLHAAVGHETTVGETCRGDATWTCSVLFANSGGNARCGTDGGGNLSADPLFCNDPRSAGDVSVRSDSPCAPGRTPQGCDGIGAGIVGCEAQAVEPRTWSAVKSIFRHGVP